MLLLHITTDAKNKKHRHRHRGQKSSQWSKWRATAWQNDNGNINSTVNLLESPLTPHGKLWKTFYLFRNHFGYHIASFFPPTPTGFGQVPRNSSVLGELRRAYYSCEFLSPDDGVQRLLKYSHPSCHTHYKYSKIYIYIAPHFQSTLQYKVGGQRHRFHDGAGVEINIKYISWIADRIHGGNGSHAFVLHHSLSFLPPVLLPPEVGGQLCHSLTPSVGRLH